MIKIENEADRFPYIAFLSTETPADPERLEYSFHTFSLKNERCYEPTRDVTFASPNQDAPSLEGGVERLVEAVLRIKTTAVVMSAETAQALLDAHADDTEIPVGKDITRTPRDVRALIAQANKTHGHDH